LNGLFVTFVGTLEKGYSLLMFSSSAGNETERLFMEMDC